MSKRLRVHDHRPYSHIPLDTKGLEMKDEWVDEVIEEGIAPPSSDLPLVNLLLAFKVQVALLNKAHVFDDKSTVIGKELHSMKTDSLSAYQALSKNIDEHIVFLRKSEPDSSEERPYLFDTSVVNGDGQGLVALTNNILGTVAKELEGRDPLSVTYEEIDQFAVTHVHTVMEKMAGVLTQVRDASDAALKERGHATSEEYSRSLEERARREAEVEPEIGASAESTGAPTGAPMAPFKDTSMVSLVVPWRFASYLVDIFRYNLFTSVGNFLDASAVIVPSLFALMTTPMVGPTTALLSLKIAKQVWNCVGSPSAALATGGATGGAVALLKVWRNVQSIPGLKSAVAESKLLEYCGEKEGVGVNGAGDFVARVFKCADLKGDELYKNTLGNGSARAATRLLYKFELLTRERIDAALSQAKQEALLTNATRLFHGLRAAGVATHDFHYRYRPALAKQYIAAFNERSNDIDEQIGVQRKLLEVIPEVYRERNDWDLSAFHGMLRDFTASETQKDQILNDRDAPVNRATRLSEKFVEPFLTRQEKLEALLGRVAPDDTPKVAILRLARALPSKGKFGKFGTIQQQCELDGQDNVARERNQAQKDKTSNFTDQEAEHDWYALRQLIMVLWKYATGVYVVDFAYQFEQLFRDVSHSFKIAEAARHRNSKREAQPPLSIAHEPLWVESQKDRSKLKELFVKYLTPETPRNKRQWSSAKASEDIELATRPPTADAEDDLGLPGLQPVHVDAEDVQDLLDRVDRVDQPVDTVAPEARRARLMRARAAIAAGGAGSVVAEAFAELRLRK